MSALSLLMNMGQNAIENFRKEQFLEERWQTLIQKSKLKCEIKSYCFARHMAKNKINILLGLFM